MEILTLNNDTNDVASDGWFTFCISDLQAIMAATIADFGLAEKERQ